MERKQNQQPLFSNRFTFVHNVYGSDWSMGWFLKGLRLLIPHTINLVLIKLT